MRKDTYKNSELDRAKPRHGFHAFINKTLKRHRADTTGLVEDSTSSTTVVRIIVGLILVHLIVIGGVLLRSHIVKNDGGAALSTATITPPPAAPVQETLPQPVAATRTTSAATGNHITQGEEDMVAIDDTTETAPAKPAPSVATPVPANTVNVPHRVATGDTLSKISKQYGVPVAAIQAANPQCKNGLRAGVYINIPVAANSEAAKKAAATAVIPTAPPAKYHVVQKGEVLGKIAAKYKISTAKLLKLNDMTEKDARKVKVGTKLKVSE